MRPPIPAQESFVELHFPAAGIDLSAAFSRQPNKPVANGIYARTTPEGVNVRAYEGTTQRCRGGSRAGLSRYLPVTPVDGWIIQLLDVMVIVDQTATIPLIATPVAPP